jgi:hypothetical protein
MIYCTIWYGGMIENAPPPPVLLATVTVIPPAETVEIPA